MQLCRNCRNSKIEQIRQSKISAEITMIWSSHSVYIYCVLAISINVFTMVYHSTTVVQMIVNYRWWYVYIQSKNMLKKSCIHENILTCTLLSIKYFLSNNF